MTITNETIDKYKSKSMSWLDAELWRLFSLWIRQKDADHRGVVRCVTCYGYRQWRHLDAGHFISRRHKILKFSEYNVYPQCKKCNGPEGGGKPLEMGRYIDKLHGLGTSQYLEELSKKSIHIDRVDYIKLIELYKNKLKANRLLLK